jgi:hypothetical protein
MHSAFSLLAERGPAQAAFLVMVSAAPSGPGWYRRFSVHLLNGGSRMGLTDLDFCQATAAGGAPARGEQTRETRARAAPPHQDTKAISNHQFGPHSHHKR